MMYIRLDFPSGIFYAATVSDPAYPEWPPNPSRLFSAIVASAYRNNLGMTEMKRIALEWIEALPPPSIAAPGANLFKVPYSYVPPGDLNPSSNKRENPVHRLKQARYFPRAYILGEPTLYYGWDQEPAEGILQILQEIARGVTHVGTSHSMVVMSIESGKMPLKASYEPNKNGSEFLRTPGKGRLAELDAVHEQKFLIRRPSAQCEHIFEYRRCLSDATKPTDILPFEFMALRIRGTMHGSDTAAYLGKSFRRAVMSVLGDNAPPSVHGHNGGVHVGWIPLPDVGHKFANGRVVGVAIAFPNAITEQERLQILAGAARVQQLRLPDGRVASVSPVDPTEPIPLALRAITWARPSTTWSTVTPVIIDRPPKRLSGGKLADAMVQSIVFAGYPEPSEIKISSFSMFKGAPPAFRIPTNKPRFHSTIRFNKPVPGPIIAGRLRYFGIGLFRPLSLSNRGAYEL